MYAIVFPGQGSQAVGMAGDFVREHAAAREVFETADAAFAGAGSAGDGSGLRTIIENGPEDALRQTEITQPAILTASIAMYRVLESELPAPPSFFAGHSLGEYSALVAAGALELGSAVSLVRRRGAFMQEAVPAGQGAMAAVMGIDAAKIEQVCAAVSGAVSCANFNSPIQTVIAGEAAAVEAATSALKEAGAKRVVPLEVSAPFHCDLMRPAQERLTPELEAATWSDARIPVVGNVEAAPYTQADDARRLLREQVCAPVRWVECVERMAQEGVKLLVEVGPGKVLSGLAARIDKSIARANVASVDDLGPALAAIGKAVS